MVAQDLLSVPGQARLIAPATVGLNGLPVTAESRAVQMQDRHRAGAPSAEESVVAAQQVVRIAAGGPKVAAEAAVPAAAGGAADLTGMIEIGR